MASAFTPGQRALTSIGLIGFMDIKRQRADIGAAARAAPGVVKQPIQRALHCGHFTKRIPANNSSHD